MAALRSATVIVVGSVNIDLNLALSHLPSAGETVVGGTLHRSLGGKGANQSVAAARLGAVTYLVGRVGADDDGRLAREGLQASGVRTDLLLDTPLAATGVAAVLTDRIGENLIGVASGANALLTADEVMRAISSIAVTDAVVLACLEIPLDAVCAAAAAARDRGYRFVLNPAPAAELPLSLLPLVSVLTPNEHELPALGLASASALLAAGVGMVAVTQGSAGVAVFIDASAAEPELVPSFAVDVVDTTGAGDAFSGCLAWALATGFSHAESVQLAAAAGALATQGTGAQGSLPTSEQVFALSARPTGSLCRPSHAITGRQG